MLKKWPQLQLEISERMTEFMRERAVLHAPMAAEISKIRQFEGESSAIIREGGDREDIQMQEHSAISEIPIELAIDGSIDTILETFDKSAKELANQQEKHIFETLHEVTSRTGNVVDAGGRPFEAETVLKVFEKMPIDFDDSGNPLFPTMVVSPKMQERVVKEMKRFEEDPELNKEFGNLMARKKEEWRAREADRILVG